MNKKTMIEQFKILLKMIYSYLLFIKTETIIDLILT